MPATGDGHPDVDRLAAAAPSRLADAISLVTDPAIVVVATVLLVALRAGPSPGRALAWAAAAIVFCVLLPYAALLLFLRAGRVADRQIVRREQRLIPGLVALACLVAGLGLLAVLRAPRPLLALVVADVAGLVALLVAGLRAKPSLHTAVVAGAVAVAVLTLGWWGVALAPLVPVVGWARVRGGRHTVGQVIAGATIGVVLSGVVFGGLRGPTAPVLQRVDVALPGLVSAMAPLDGKLLLGTYAASARPRAGLLLLDPAASDGVARVPISPVTPYAFEGSWRLLATEGARVLGVAGAVGGAHGNVRWTLWRGGVGGVAEEEQSFWTFGGWEMGSLTGAGFVGGREFVAGSWKSASTGLDIATWHARGTTWARDESTGTPLASTPRALAGSVAAVGGGSGGGASGGALLLGSTTLLGPGEVSVVPSVWTGIAGVDGMPRWTRHDLPLPGGLHGQGSVEAGACQAHGPCIVAGRVAGRLAVWTWDGSAGSSVAIPEVTLADDDRVVGVAFDGASPWIAVARSRSVSVAGGGARCGEVVRRGADRHTDWVVEATPDGRMPTALATVSGHLWLATDAPALWTTH